MYPLVAIEGISGAGKTVIRDSIVDNWRLNQKPFTHIGQYSWLSVSATRNLVAMRRGEYKGSKGDLISAHITDKQLHEFHNVVPALEKGIVLADRYLYSDAAFLYALYDIPPHKTLSIYRSLRIKEPNIVLFINTPLELALQRLQRRRTSPRYHESASTLAKLLEGYQIIFESCFEPGNSVEVLNLPSETEADVQVAISKLGAVLKSFI